MAALVGARPLEFGRELDALESRLRRELDRLPPALRRLEASLPALLGKEGAGERWVDRFAPLTLLYPLLHAEVLDPRHARAARALVLPQTLLVLHAFLDDRRRDRQVEWSLDHAELDAWLVDRALEAVAKALGGEAARRAGALMQACAKAQDVPADGSSDSELADHVVRRHVLGFVVTRCLLDAAAAPVALIEAAFGVFRALALGLQWLDDVEDLEEDLATGAPNLLVRGLPREATAGGGLAAALDELERRFALDGALAAAARCFEAARETSRSAGALQLAELIAVKTARAWSLADVLALTRAQLAAAEPCAVRG